MAKNSLHIKNSQLAEAINLSGLKAKLSRKKSSASAEEAQSAREEEITFSTLSEPSSQSVEHPVVEIHDEPVVETFPEKVSEAPVVEPQRFIAPEPVVEMPPVSPVVESVVVKPIVPEAESAAPRQPPAEPPRKPETVRREFLPPSSRPSYPERSMGMAGRRLEGHPSGRPSRGFEKEAPAPKPFTPTRVAPRPPQPTPVAPPPFISASRNNPEQLGPVVREPPPPPKPRPKPVEPQERSRKDEQDIFVGEPRGSEFVGREGRPSFRPGERPPYRAGERPPFRPGERPPYRAGEAGPYGSGAPRRFDGPRPMDRPAPFRPGMGAPDRSHPAGWLPPAGNPDEEKSHRIREPSEKKLKAKTWDPKQKPVELKGSKQGPGQSFDTRMRHGLGSDDDESSHWKKRRPKHKSGIEQMEVSRPTKISVRLPISVKDLAVEMKLKASQLISKMFLQGLVVTLNDMLSDDTQVQLLGAELGCEVVIDTTEQERIRITDKSIGEEISVEKGEDLVIRPPVVTFMGHVDHGKTSLIDAIRKSNRASGEVGAITQHIGALTCVTDQGPITIIDTPGHEAFSAMRERGASITDVVVLVVAGDEGIKEQTVEAIKQAQDSKATIIVAINKCDKPNFDQDRVFRQLAEVNLLPEAWGGSVVTVACSALTLQGVKELLEMIALQAEVLELRANPNTRARGTVVESQMSKGLGLVATMLVQNGTLHQGDCLVFGSSWARVKSMRDDQGNEVQIAGPSMPVRITGLSDLPSAGEEFIVVKNEKEARNIAENRKETLRQQAFLTSRRVSLENMMEKASTAGSMKVLNIVLRADVQGSLEAVKNALQKIESKKVCTNIISCGVGDISESDVELAATSKAIIVGFHTSIEAHAEPMVKTYSVPVRLHSIIYHAQDDIRALMKGLLDKTAEEQSRGKAEVKTLFKSSQLGTIAGCIVLDGSISRNCNARLIRDGQTLWQGPISSLKRFKDDVKEVSKGTECGIVLQGFSNCMPGDILEAYEIVYHEQDL